jgi:hypothetical protein
MTILFVHLSDIHFQECGNSVFNKIDHIIRAIQNVLSEVDEIFFLTTGDISGSGKVEEYQMASDFYSKIKSEVIKHSSLSPFYIFVPGNHDCDHGIKRSSVRDIVIDNIIRNETDVDEEMIDQCCEVQDNYFGFIKSLITYDFTYYHKLLQLFVYTNNDYKVLFYCYNTSWISKKDDIYGKIYYPYNFFPHNIFEYQADLIFSILHHPINWNTQSHIRDFSTHLRNTSDMILTGHEHFPSKSVVSDFNSLHTEYIEGAILQDIKDDNISSFNTITINFKNKLQRIINYKWNGCFYSTSDDITNWIPFIRSKHLTKKLFEINDNFEKELDDMGTAFCHPRKNTLSIDDLFVFPSLLDLKAQQNEKNNITNNIIDSSTLQNYELSHKLFIFGSDKSGKSSLFKILYKYYYESNFLPIYIDGRSIKSSTLPDFKKLINNCFCKQYSDKLLEQFYQYDNNKVIIFIDDFDKAKLNSHHKMALLKNINDYYDNLFISCNDMYRIEEMIVDEKDIVDTINDFQQFCIKEFGYYLRNAIINKWNSVGIDLVTEDSEIIRKNDSCESIMNTIIGRNYVPSYPIYILTILQTIEAGQPHDLKESSYGYYYEYLITSALGGIGIIRDDLDTYYNYLSELAFYFKKNKYDEISEETFKNFHDQFCDEYRTNINYNDLRDNLIRSRLLEVRFDNYKFRYKYIFYFFVAKYISNNIGENQIREYISLMCNELYKEDYANILLFLSHHSKDPFIIDELLSKAKRLFSKNNPIKFDNDIQVINELLSEIPILVIGDVDVRKNRESILKSRDEIELRKKNKSILEDINEESTENNTKIDIISEVNLSFKTIEILGQILKNYHGSLKGNQKYIIGEEAYLLGLRSINAFFSILRSNINPIVDQIRIILDKKGIIDKQNIEKYSKRMLFHISELLFSSLIKKISNSIGSEKLSETYKDIISNNDINSFHLVDLSIKLDYYKHFPFDDIKKLSERFKNNIMPSYILKRMAVHYIYMFPTTFLEKQKICDIIDIPIQKKLINNKSLRKERRK